MSTYRSLHSARRSLHQSTLADGTTLVDSKGGDRKVRIQRMERNLAYALTRLITVEKGLPVSLTLDAPREAPRSWLGAELLPVDKTIAEVHAIRRILDKHIKRVEKLTGKPAGGP